MNHYFTSLCGQTPLRNSIAMATSKVPGDQKLFEAVCYTLTLSYPGGGIRPLLFFLCHPKTAQGIRLKHSDFKDTLLRHILQVKPVR